MAKFIWDEQEIAYQNEITEEYISSEDARSVLDDFIDRTSEALVALALQLMAGAISLASWQLATAALLKEIHVAAASVARGGLGQMSQADFGFVGALIKNQYQFLQNFANQIADGTQLLNRNLLRRARMYGQAARSTYEDMRRRIMRDKGVTHEQRVLGVAEHCTTQGGLLGCLELSALGWRPIGTLPRIGNTPCRTNCHCRFRFGRLLNNGKIEIVG